MKFSGLSNRSIQQKQMFILAVTSTVALLFAFAGFVIYELTAVRADMKVQLSRLAQQIGWGNSADILFGDAAAATNNLANTLRGDPAIVAACIYDTNGEIFATYPAGATGVPLRQPPSALHFDNNRVVLSQAVTAPNQAVTVWVYLRATLQPMYRRLQEYAIVLGGIFVASLLAAVGLSTLLQRIISAPILHLLEIAKAVAENKRYDMRAIKRSNDELGTLTDGFNAMLSQIQERDSQLQRAKEALENRVAERTAQLAEANAALQRENAERKQAEEILRTQEERTRLIIDQAFDAVITTDSNHRIIGWNRQAEQTLGWARTEAIGLDMIETMVCPSRHEQRRERLARFKATGEWPELNRLIETTAMHRDGKELVAELTITPIRLGEEWIFTIFLREISERKKAEAALQDAHQKLVSISRQAGMAEVATSVLHNVGNVLNSINVAATVAEDQMRQSCAGDFASVAELLGSRTDDLGQFLTAEPGRKIPAFLGVLAKTLAGEHAAILGELAALRKNIEHVKEIISMQQSYARVSGVFENIEVTELLEDTLRMNAGSLSRHNVKIVRDYGPVPPICTDKHKVLQILINLLRNAKYACDESGRQDKKVILRALNRENGVRIAVIDNGIGIPPENLRRIFNHGFTTRQDGHGFGLHSGALAAKELGGSLAADSEGIGRGATFTLELPNRPPLGSGVVVTPDQDFDLRTS